MDEEPKQLMISSLDCTYQLIENEGIRAVASCLAEMDLLISNDTGIMHVGAAVGTPVLSLFGPTDATQWAPKGDRNRYLAAPHGVMDEIAEEDVVRTADEMLRRRRNDR